MPDLNSLEDIYAAITAGRFERQFANRIITTGATSAAGRTHEAFTSAGTGGALAFTGSAGVATQLSRASTGALPLNGSTPMPRRLLNFAVMTPSAVVAPGWAALVDLLLYYPGLSASAPTALNNGVGLPARATGERDIQAAGIITTAFGAASPIIDITYTDQDNNPGAVGRMVSPVNSAPAGTLLGGGVAANNNSPQAFLAAGDTGVRSVQSYSLSGGTTGAWALLLYRVIATVPIVAANAYNERSSVFDTPSMPPIPDDACLGLIVGVGGALTVNQVITAQYNYAWGTP